MNNALQVAPEIAAALREAAPVVALESALITHGFARPANLTIAQSMAAAVRQAGALPAVIAIVQGHAKIGLTDEEMAELASQPLARKVSLRDLPIALAQGASGGTTVAATMALAHQAGLQVFATGGIGGVHRGHPEDISADLPALASLPLVVVCSGAKAILDLPRTLEHLETHGVPVIGYGTDEFPAFYSRTSGLKVDTRVDTPEEVARIAAARQALGLRPALLVCAPVPEQDALPVSVAEGAIAQALQEAEAAGISGKQLTPFMLAKVAEITGGQARRANEALLVHNASVAASIAGALRRSHV
ncbi:MAG: pseudouridine-5'-phosphate glycosidase [Anaerolineales bacterium]|nr:pseudouridine-5'-phosphate glycosidase [Anaerolineales bacterium]